MCCVNWEYVFKICKLFKNLYQDLWARKYFVLRLDRHKQRERERKRSQWGLRLRFQCAKNISHIRSIKSIKHNSRLSLQVSVKLVPSFMVIFRTSFFIYRDSQSKQRNAESSCAVYLFGLSSCFASLWHFDPNSHTTTNSCKTFLFYLVFCLPSIDFLVEIKNTIKFF